MPKIFRIRKAETALLQKGLQRNNSHHRQFQYYTLQGVKTQIRTKMSHSGRGADLSVRLLMMMARDLKLSLKQMESFVECTMTQEQYEEHLRSKKLM